MASARLTNTFTFGPDGSSIPRASTVGAVSASGRVRALTRVPDTSVARTEALLREEAMADVRKGSDNWRDDRYRYRPAGHPRPRREPLLVTVTASAGEEDPIARALRGLGAVQLWTGVWFVLGNRWEIEAELMGAQGFAVMRADPSIAFQLPKTSDAATRLHVEEFLVPHLIRNPAPRATYINGGRAAFLPIVERFERQGAASATPTPLCRLMLERGSDKGVGWHNYTPFYSCLFDDLFDGPHAVESVFEIGLGTSDVSVPSNMGMDGVPGASLRGWRDYFPRALVGGADVDRKILFHEDRIRTAFVDQTDPASFDVLWRTLPMSAFDIFIDDGLHTLEAAVLTFAACLAKVRPGGLYIVEDVPLAKAGHYVELARASGLPGLLIELPHHLNHVDNALLVVRHDMAEPGPKG